MILKECYVENFGTLHQFSFCFEQGVNTICEANGWGKSTFAAFIKAMFYGMDTSRKKNLDEAERKKYKPWQGGRYGGFLVFEAEGKEYKIERFFGEKESEDSFVLYNQKTGLVSIDYSASVGEELFKLDKAAYARSTYIPQNAIPMETNDSINAKLSNLLEHDDDQDMNRFDGAMKALDNAKKVFVKTGGKGKIEMTRNKIAQLESEFERCNASFNAADGWKEELQKIVLQKETVKKERLNIKKQLEEASKYEAAIVKAEQYQELCQTYKSVEEERVPLLRFFEKKLPTEQEIENCEALNQELLKLQGARKSYEFTQAETVENERILQSFTKKIPEAEELHFVDYAIQEYHTNEIKIAASTLTREEEERKSELETFFKHGVPGTADLEEITANIAQLNEVNSKITTEKSKLELLQNMQMQTLVSTKEKEAQHLKSKQNKALLLGFVFIVLGIILFFIAKPVGIVTVALGMILCIISQTLLRTSDKKQAQNATVNGAKTETSQDKAQGSLSEIQSFIDNLTAQKQFLEQQFTSFLEPFGIRFDLLQLYSELSNIRSNKNEYEILLRKVEDQELTRLKLEQARIVKEIDGILLQYLEHLPVVIEEKEHLWNMVKKDYQALLLLQEKTKNRDKINQNYKEVEKQLSECLLDYAMDVECSLPQKVMMLKENHKEYFRLSNALKVALLKKEQFEKEQDVLQLQAMTTPEFKLADLQEMEKVFDEKVEKLTSEENNAKNQIRDLSEEADRCPDIQNEIEQLRDDLKVSEARFHILEKTSSCLKESKDNYATRYLEPMKKGFEQYAKLLDHNIGELHMDVSLQVNIQAYGARRTMDYFSTGYRDLVGLATRFALVDALFLDEKPFVLLDDPFTNLDGDKLDKARSLLQEISKQYQIIYLVCHESRVV